MSASVLFDAPGPRGRAVSAVGNVVAALAVLAGLGWLVSVLAAKGQFEPSLWQNAVSAEAWQFYYLPGLQNTLRSAMFATVGAVVFGIVFGVGRLSRNRAVRWISGVVVEFFRAVPVLLMMIFFYMFFSAQAQWIADRPFAAVVVALVLYNGSVIAELVRAGVGNLPKGQGEAGLAIGLTPGQTLRSVQLPQALVAMLPAMVSQLVVVLKDSALGQFILYSELLRSAQILSAKEQNPLQALVVVAIVFILINWLLTVAAHRLARLLSSRTAGETVEGTGIGNPTAVGGFVGGGPGPGAGGGGGV
ncbi:glutamate transport system permease protein [Promicromonospora sp. AC04]|uniref:amino acid ABC transporter permease n=1 Tax=Promicromonospora sp. AC04 TaxID=2135723 RepID=UPI000D3392FD|nr:amino acid ABC transporter permease [Promicromonospora sp. AC04]PUB31657.1 glutamate transport system permease protein [Promicromonospora sp. AC04]